MGIKRRTVLTGLATSGIAVAGGAFLLNGRARSAENYFGTPGEFPCDVIIDHAQLLHPANSRLCGSNVQWVDGGDGLLPRGLEFDAAILESVKALGSTVIRYPGGSQGDVYNWRHGIGPESARGRSEHFHRKEAQVVRFGTAEFLALCESANAEALISVNVATGAAKDAGDWVRQTNVTGLISPLTGRSFRPVGYWEIGNEPYLKEDQRPETWTPPQEYAIRADAAIREMRAADPAIAIGIPLRSDSFNGLPVTPYPGFNEQVLKSLREHYDFVALHNAYLPFVYDRTPNDEETYAALMAASETVRSDILATRAQLTRLIPGRKMPIAITEYNALVTIGRSHDAYLASPAGALYVADLLRLFSTQTDILMANHWSLIGNWHFGALSSQGKRRPVYYVLQMFRTFLQGTHVGLNIATRSFRAPAIGVTRPGSDFPTVTGSATRSADRLRVVLINKDPVAASRVNLRLKGPGKLMTVAVRSLIASSRFADAEQAHALQAKEHSRTLEAASYALVLAPTSVSLLDFSVSSA